jgi:hypothetical protein
MSLELNIDGDSLEAMINGIQLPSQNSTSQDDNTATPAKKSQYVPRPRGTPPRMIQEAQRRQAEEAERRAKMNPSKNTTVKISRSSPNVNPNDLSTLQPTPAMRRVIIAGRVKYIPAPLNRSEMISSDSLPNISPVKIEMPEEVRRSVPAMIARRMSNSGPRLSLSGSQTSQRTKKIPSFIAKKMNEEARQHAIRSARTLDEVRKIKLAQQIEPIEGDDIRKYTIAQMRAMRAQQARDARIHNQHNRVEPQESAADKIKNDPNMSNLAKAIALKRLANRPRKTLSQVIE